MKEILLENGFPLEFPEDAMEEAARIPDEISNSEIKKERTSVIFSHSQLILLMQKILMMQFHFAY